MRATPCQCLAPASQRPAAGSASLCGPRRALPPRGQLPARQRSAPAPCRPPTVRVQAFSLTRSLGISGTPRSWLPGLLPDFGLPRRQAVLDAFFRISDGGPALDREARDTAWRGGRTPCSAAQPCAATVAHRPRLARAA